MPLNLRTIVADFARAIALVDAVKPTAINQRSKQHFKPGIGPHTETATVALVMGVLSEDPLYGAYSLGAPYPEAPRQKCDVCIGEQPPWAWAIEIKLLRFLGDNGSPNDNILMHILSPYAAHRSALTDCTKLNASAISHRKAIIIYGFESTPWPLGPAIDAFELLAKARGRLGERSTAPFRGLVHPVHEHGAVFGWELLPPG